ncbi:hypothetical protein ACOIBK_28695, partial [Klebsiella pneumoniae]
LITPNHPGQTLIHVHPDPNELNRTYRTDIAICSGMWPIANDLVSAKEPSEPRADAREAHADYLAWSAPASREGVKLDLGP